jgi:phenylacetate-CoA ligase
MIANALLDLVRSRRNQWLEPDALRRIQLEKLKALLKHAYENVAYYHSLFDSVGLQPEDVESLDDLRRIPITTKAHLQSVPVERLVARGVDVERCIARRTSGSTGRPLTIHITPEEKLGQTVVSLRILMANGLRLSDKLAYIGDPRSFSPQDRWFQRLGLLRRVNVSIFDDSEELLQAIGEAEPDVVYGYPTSLALLASKVRASRSDFAVPRLTFSTAELLTPQVRQLIESVFDVRDVYGTVECGDIAWECERREGHHVNVDYLVTEVLRDGQPVPPGEAGEFVCTSLHSYAMPMIRYRLGDTCVMSAEQCSCGRGLPLMKVIQGRSDDFVSLLDGRSLSPIALVNAMRNVDGVARYRIVQEQDGRLLAQIVASDAFSEETLGCFKATLSGVVGEQLEIEVNLVDEIPRDATGKMRSIISKVDPGLGLQSD